MEVAQEEEIERYRLHGEAILNAEEIDQSGDEGEDYCYVSLDKRGCSRESEAPGFGKNAYVILAREIVR